MKIRRITLAVLALLTVLFVADVRYFGERSSTRQPSVQFDVSRSTKVHEVEKQLSFTHSQEAFTSLVLKGQYGMTELRSTAGEEIVVYATIGADSEEDLEKLELVETVSGSELRYELSGTGGEGPHEAGLSFVVEAPSGMEVSVEQNFGQVRINNFRGLLSLQTNFSEIQVLDLEGTVNIQSNFGVLDLRRIAGPVNLNDTFSTSKIDLLPIDGGYDFDVEMTNGVLKGNAPFQTSIGQDNKVVARGQSGDGAHPVMIRSSFGTVTVNLGE